MFFILNGSHSFCKNPYYYTNYSQVPSPGILSKFWELSIITYGNPVVVLDPSVRKPRQLFIIKGKKKVHFCHVDNLLLFVGIDVVDDLSGSLTQSYDLDFMIELRN